MATKTIVCPECQAPATPGRYACVRCGALMASIGMVSRASGEVGSTERAGVILPVAESLGEAPHVPLDPSTVGPHPGHLPDPIAPAWTQSLAAEPVDSAPSPGELWDDELPTADIAVASASEIVDPRAEPLAVAASDGAVTGRTSKPASAARLLRARSSRSKPVSATDALAPAMVDAPAPAMVDAPAPAMAAAPDLAVAVAPDPPARRKPATRPRPPLDPTAIDRIAPLAQLTAEIERSAAATAAQAHVATGSPLEAEAREAAAVAATGSPMPPIPGWPPPGDLAMAMEPLVRVPAGAYLPPSAVLPPGEALPVPTDPMGRAGDQDRREPTGSMGHRSTADRLSDLGLPDDMPRLIVSVGSSVAALSFLLPWTAGPVGGDALGDYWARWGLAAPGHWIVAGLLVILAVIAVMGGSPSSSTGAEEADARAHAARPDLDPASEARTGGRLPGVGLPSIALASLVLGLAWPYLFGFLGRAVGLWVVLPGLLLLLAGGLLDLRGARHRSPFPTV